MKKIINFTITMLLLILCNATSLLYGQITFSARAGFNLAGIFAGGVEDYEYTEISYKMIPRFQIGGIADFEMDENVSVQSGLLLMGKGAKILETDSYGFPDLDEDVYTEKYTPVYLQIPFHIFYSKEGFFIGGGPYFGLAIGGKIKDYDKWYSEKRDLNIGNSRADNWAPFDLGIGIQTGVNLKSARIGIGYDLGILNNIPKDEPGKESWRNSVINIFATYPIYKL